MGELHVVDQVVLLGTPVTTEPAKWQKAEEILAARARMGKGLTWKVDLFKSMLASI